jgi:spermidine/putrescine transport system substrate-binding protein
MGDRITLLIWPDYVDPATLTAFEHETGVGVNVEIFPSAVALLDRMRDGSRPPDVLTPPSYAVVQLAKSGRLARLDHSRLPNLHHLEPRFLLGRPHDPESRLSIIKDWGTTGFMYRIDKIPELPKSWEDFWRLAEKYSGRVTVLDSPGEVIGAALKMRGRSYNASGGRELADARLDLLRLKPHLLCFETNYRPLLASAEAWLSLGWNGDAVALKAEGVPVWYVIPSEGSQIWEDDWAIAAHARNPSAAHAFLDFLLRPAIAAQEARYTRYATANRSAVALLDNATRQDPSTYPPDELIRKLEAGMPIAADGQQRRKALWEEIRS